MVTTRSPLDAWLELSDIGPNLAMAMHRSIPWSLAKDALRALVAQEIEQAYKEGRESCAAGSAALGHVHVTALTDEQAWQQSASYRRVQGETEL